MDVDISIYRAVKSSAEPQVLLLVMRLALTYSLFALIATVLNVGAQHFSSTLYSGRYALLTSLFIGTVVGLAVKYVLDRRYIFEYSAGDVKGEARTFYLYVLMGGATTALFWSLEIGFDQIFGSREMRYLGGILGLCAGYYLKYQLDKKYVFS